jgi:hypothetical protein
MEIEKESFSRRLPSQELGLIEKNKLELLAFEQSGYRAIRNRENGMTPCELTITLVTAGQQWEAHSQAVLLP